MRLKDLGPECANGRLLVVYLCLASLRCGPARFPPVPVYPTQVPEAEVVIYLIGDAGEATLGSPVLTHLKREVAERSGVAEVVVVFLGDNIYDYGLHEPSHPDHEKDLERLEAQIDVIRGTTARGVFIPGNHDWGYPGARGLQTVQRQAAHLATVSLAGARVLFLPVEGCPGPVQMPVAESVLLVLLDTEWWLRNRERLAGSSCPNNSREEVLRSLRLALHENAAASNRRVVALGHHPLKTYGPHGGYFGLKDMFFPATNLWEPLYVPVPFLYPIVRNSGITNQDLSGPQYARMRRQLTAVFSEFSGHPLVYAAGHEHALQVFEGSPHGVGYILVSGAGSKLKNVGNSDALFAVGGQHRELGYMRLEFLKDGAVLLSVITDGTRSCDDPKAEECRGEPTVRYWRWLTEVASEQR